jgi:uncharacterized protein YdiU (UPF0061 family)
MRAKLGLPGSRTDEVITPLVEELLTLLQRNRVDHTTCYRDLAAFARGNTEPIRGKFLDLPAFDSWAARWLALGPDADLMDRVNPVYVPRNQLLEQALAAASEADLDPMGRLLDAVTHPYVERPDLAAYAAPASDDIGSYQTFCGT